MANFKMRLIFICFIGFSCGSATKQTSQFWESKERKISFLYYSPLTLLPTLDKKSETLTGVIDNNDGKSYVVHIGDDISKEKFNDKAYFNDIKRTMIRPNLKNRLIKEDSITFHGQIFHRQIYFMYTPNWGLLKQLIFVRRTGTEFYSIQISFPTQESDSVDTDLPKQVT